MDKKLDKNITKKFRTNRPAKIWTTMSDKKTDKKILHKGELSSDFMSSFLSEILSEVSSYFLTAFCPKTLGTGVTIDFFKE